MTQFIKFYFTVRNFGFLHPSKSDGVKSLFTQTGNRKKNSFLLATSILFLFKGIFTSVTKKK